MSQHSAELNELLVHVSFEEVKEFALRIPAQRAPKEDGSTPRICFSTDIHTAITAMPNGGGGFIGAIKIK